MDAYILAKNEEANIERSVSAARRAGLAITVLDSGSQDATRERARALGARVEPYVYVDHLTAYEQLCRERIAPGALGLILDADLVISDALAAELRTLDARPDVDVVQAPVEMWWDGVPLPFGSLYPPKAIAFRGGQSYFQAAGHGERLRAGLRITQTTGTLAHDDRKPYESYLTSQARYAANLVRRAQERSLTWRDRLRLFTPAMMLGVPLYSLLARGGLASGRVGLVYALDRLIAEAVMLRQSLAAPLGAARDQPERAAPPPSNDEIIRS